MWRYTRNKRPRGFAADAIPKDVLPAHRCGGVRTKQKLRPFFRFARASNFL
jgi:hypothetical protein